MSAGRRPPARPLRGLSDFIRDRAGVSTVEFAMATPVILLILAGTVDLGRALMTKFELASAVSASTNYALLNATRVNAEAGSALANEIATVAASALNLNMGDISVVINNGSAVTVSDGASTASGTASNAQSCYCPSVTGGVVAWGTSKTCGSVCSGGGIAGKFVTVTASKPYTPMFGGYGIVDGDSITVRAIVQPQ